MLDNLPSSFATGTEKEGSGSGNMILNILQEEKSLKQYSSFIAINTNH